MSLTEIMKWLIYNNACECLLPLNNVILFTTIVIAFCIKWLPRKLMIYVVSFAPYSYGCIPAEPKLEK
jgi:hypothetical protein